MMDNERYISDLCGFLEESPTAFHAVSWISRLLKARGFSELRENASWEITAPGSYFVRRNGSSLTAFTIVSDNLVRSGLRMAGAHTDSPSLKIKPHPEMKNHGLLQLGVEVYGGALLDPWFDRDLTIAGRVTIRDKEGAIRNVLIHFKRPVAVIPSLAIHLNREANEQKKINKQNDLVPIIALSEGDEGPGFVSVIQAQVAEEHGITNAEILGHELFLCDAQPPSIIGSGREFLTGSRLDNLISCFSIMRALLDAGNRRNSLIVLQDHEEVGSQSQCGAQGSFLQDTLERLIPDSETRQRCINRSLFISADNAHAVHPNFKDRYDGNHLPRLNMGPVIKYNASQRYATTARSAAFYRVLSERADVPVQEFVMRSDLACGSTIGPITASALGIQTVDVGVPSLAMHSIRETAGTKDAWLLYRTLMTYFASPSDDPMWQCIGE